jgi:Ni/Fe-hydrogenase subunit HybB-like protein
MGQPIRAMNIILHPTPNSVMFWDLVALSGYLVLNVVIGWTTLDAERKSLPPPAWVKPLIYISIPWAISIHTVTAFLYAGLPGRDYWLTAIMAARFLASAFSGGPAFLLLSALVIKRFTKFDPGREAILTLSKIITYAMVANVFFIGLELFTSFYSNLPGHMHPFEYLYVGAEGHGKLAPLMWISNVAAVLSLIMLLVPPWRRRENVLAAACIILFISLWIDKGFGLVVGGFVPNPFGEVFEYWPTAPEVLITMGVWALGLFVLTVLHKVAVSVKESVQ